MNWGISQLLRVPRRFDILEEIKMAKILHVQTVLMEEDIEALKSKTGESTTKDAITKAVNHYLECEYTKVEDMFAKKLQKVIKRKQKEEEEE
jgi:hypothetical protein